MNWTQYVSTVKSMLTVPENDSDFDSILPRMIEYAELRIYRDFDFLCTLASQTVTLTSGSRNVALPTNVIVLQSANVITPATQSNPELGTRNPITRVGLDFMNAVYGASSVAALPKYYAEIGNPTFTSTTIAAGPINIVVGPAPDANYTLETIGTVRPSLLSQTNTTTFISVNLPDLLVAASMIFGAGYRQNYGAQADDPKMAMSWEQTYQTLKAGATVEELRKKARDQS